jgi:hypothetical protein
VLRIFISIVVVALLSACAAQPVSLSPKASAVIQKLDVAILIPQANLNIEVESSNAGSGGILGAIIVTAIDDVRRSKASQAQATLTKSVEDFNFRNKMVAQQAAEFSRTDVASRFSPLQMQIVDSESQRKIFYDNSKASAVLFSRIDYKWVSGSLVATSNNIIYPKISALRSFREKPNESNVLDIGNAIFRKIHTFKRESVTEKNINAVLSEAVTNLAWQLATDLQYEMGGRSTLASALPLIAGTSVSAGLQPNNVAAQSSATPFVSVPAAPPKTQVAVAPSSSNAVNQPAMMATGFANINDVDAIPYIGDKARENYKEWLTKTTPRAIVISASGGWAYTWGNKPTDPSEFTDPLERALARCNKNNADSNVRPCKAYAINNSVVWGK